MYNQTRPGKISDLVVMCSFSIFHVSLEGWEIYFQAPMTIDFPHLWVETPESQTHN